MSVLQAEHQHSLYYIMQFVKMPQILMQTAQQELQLDIVVSHFPEVSASNIW